MESINHFNRNTHVSIQDVEDILRMIYFWCEKLAYYISEQKKHNFFETRRLRYLVTPQRHKMTQTITCNKDH